MFERWMFHKRTVPSERNKHRPTGGGVGYKQTVSGHEADRARGYR